MQEFQKTRSVVCLYIFAVLNILINCLLVESFIINLQKCNVYEMMLMGAFEIWQLANVLVSITCAIDQSKAHAFKLYFYVNMIELSVLSSVALVFGAYIFIKSNSFIELDIWLVTLWISCIGITGFVMIYEAHKITDEKFKPVENNDDCMSKN